MVTVGILLVRKSGGGLDLAPHAILRLAATQLDRGQYEGVYEAEWLPELEYILKKS